MLIMLMHPFIFSVLMLMYDVCRKTLEVKMMEAPGSRVPSLRFIGSLGEAGNGICASTPCVR